MELLAHNFRNDFIRGANLAKGTGADAQPLIAFRDATQLSLIIRATAFVFADPRSRALHDVIARIAPSDATVLITGETGTGKELVARHVHAMSNRSNAKFVAINCGAFSETLIESELFGYERGAFTGALQGKAGWFETANGGTLFLDEIGDLPLAMQVKLLRVLQEREVVRLGARLAVPINVRLIAATNIDLSAAVRAGRFREDLYYRLQVISLPVSPLRERRGDILPLAQHFLTTYARRLQVDQVRLSADAEQALLAYPWPGNIRELENIIHRAVLLSRAGYITPAELNLPGWHNAGQSISTAAGQSASNSPYPGSQCGNSPEPAAAWPATANCAEAAPALRPPLQDAEAALLQAWQTLLQSDQAIDFEVLQQQLVLAAWEHSQRNQVRAAKRLNLSRNVLRTFLKRAQVID